MSERKVAATLRLDPDEAGVLDAALRYYRDTLVEPDDADDQDRENIETAEAIRVRLGKSIARHGFTLFDDGVSR